AFMPSFGVLGIGGVISLALGSFLLFDTQDSGVGVDRSIIFAAVGTLASFVLAITYLVYRSQKSKPTLGFDGMLGEICDVRAKLNPAGKVFVRGELWNAEADGEIDMGEKVEIVGYQGLNLKVRRLSGRSSQVEADAHMFGLGVPVTVVILIVIAIISGIKILKEYERAVVFRLGRMVGSRGPGMVYIIPGIEKMVRMDLRTVTMDVPPQDVITRDNVSVKVNAVL